MKIEITKLTSKGQIVLPQDIREEKNLKVGERFLVYDTEDSIILKRIKNLEKASDINEFEKAFAKTWKISKEKGISKKDIDAEITAYRKEKNA